MRILARTLVVGAVAAAALSCSSSSTTAASGGGVTGTLDGTWDITTAGSAPIGPSEMTVSQGSVHGFIATTKEGTADVAHAGCTHSKDRSEFDFEMQGNAASGTIKNLHEWTGTGCPTNTTQTSSVAGTRTRTEAASDTDLNGDWDLQVTDGGSTVVVISGLSGQAWAKADKVAGKPASVTVSIANGQATVAAAQAKFSFAARRR
jgi:hypothetical protein